MRSSDYDNKWISSQRRNETLIGKGVQLDLYISRHKHSDFCHHAVSVKVHIYHCSEEDSIASRIVNSSAVSPVRVYEFRSGSSQRFADPHSLSIHPFHIR